MTAPIPNERTDEEISSDVESMLAYFAAVKVADREHERDLRRIARQWGARPCPDRKPLR